MSSSKIRYVYSDSPALQNGYGVPNHIEPLGSIYVDNNDGVVYVNKDGLVDWVTIIDTTYPLDTLAFTGGTVNGPTIFTNGLTANTISATSINKVDYIIFNTGTTSAATVAGTVYFDNTEKSLSYNTSINQGVTVNLGQQNYLRVFNNSGLDIQKGKGIELLSSYSGLPAVQLAVNRHYNDRDVVGVSAEIIPNNSEGIVLTYGIISNITVTGASIGSLVYASDTTPGEFKNSTEFLNFPLTARTNAIGYIIQTGTTTGKLFVNPVNENNNLSLTDLQRNILEGNAISTGVFSFGGISLASSTTFNVGPAEGWIVDNTTNPLVPDVFYVKYTGQTNIPSLYYSSATQTYLLLTSAGTLTQQTTYPTPQQRRQSIYLAKMGHGNRTSLINAFNEPDFEISPISQIRDMFTPIKLINENVYPSPNTGLTFNTSSGILWGLGIGFATNQLNPSSITISGNSPTTFQYRTQTGGTATNRITIDPANYDLNGVVTSIGSPAKQATNQRIYLLQNGQFRIQYGQTKYADLTTAIAAVNTEPFTTFSNFKDNAILIGILSVRSDASLLSDTLQAKITFASKFGESVGGTGGVSTTNLQQAYNNSTTPEIVINSTLDGLSIQNGTGNADNVTRLLEGLNGAGNATSFIRADGDISGTTIQTNAFTANSTGLSATTISATTYQNLPSLAYLPLSGGTITGPTVMNDSQPLTLVSTNYSPGSSGSILYFLTQTSSGYTSINTRSSGGASGGNLILQNFSENVGIGTTNPTYKLDVDGIIRLNGELTLPNSANIILGTTWGTGNLTLFNGVTDFFKFDIPNNRVVNNLNKYLGNGPTSFGTLNTDEIKFVTNNSTERMIITSGGTVGIGTSTPTEKLDVNGVIRGVYPSDPAGGATIAKFLAYSPNPFGLVFRSSSTGTSSIQNQRENNISQVYNLTLQPYGGNVGIFTVTPNYKLEVNGSFGATSVSATTITATTYNGKGTYGNIIMDTSNNQSMIVFSGSGTVGGTGYTDFIRVTNTAAGVTNPSKTFRTNITGDFEIINDAYTSTIFSLTNAGVLNTSGGGTSDLRTKKNIEYIYDETTTFIKNLKPVKFEFKNNENIKRHGFIAQDILELYPELVLGNGNEENGVYGLDYDGILSLTVKALQESIARIEELESVIKELKNNNN